MNSLKKRKTPPVDDEYTAQLRNELLGLAERKLIKHTEVKIKKASKVEPERIIVKFQQEQAEIVNNCLSETLIRKHRRTGDKNLGGLTPFRPKTIFY